MKEVASRAEVFAALDSEDAYARAKWNEDTTASGGSHSPAEWLVYMQDYLTEAIKYASRYADPESRELVLNTVRKITNMGVTCMVQNGAPRREVAQVTEFE